MKNEKDIWRIKLMDISISRAIVQQKGTWGVKMQILKNYFMQTHANEREIVCNKKTFLQSNYQPQLAFSQANINLNAKTWSKPFNQKKTSKHTMQFQHSTRQTREGKLRKVLEGSSAKNCFVHFSKLSGNGSSIQNPKVQTQHHSPTSPLTSD